MSSGCGISSSHTFPTFLKTPGQELVRSRISDPPLHHPSCLANTGQCFVLGHIYHHFIFELFFLQGVLISKAFINLDPRVPWNRMFCGQNWIKPLVSRELTHHHEVLAPKNPQHQKEDQWATLEDSVFHFSETRWRHILCSESHWERKKTYCQTMRQCFLVMKNFYLTCLIRVVLVLLRHCLYNIHASIKRKTQEK